MADSDQDINTNDSPGVSVTATLQIALAVVIFNLALFIFILILYIRAKVLRRNSSRTRRLIFAPYEPSLPRHALDISILNSLPITVFQSKDFKEENACIECAVCICELKDGEEVRFLPKCKHGFHVECIDMWFHSNNTCPLCRSLVTHYENLVEIPIEPLEAVMETGTTSSSSSNTSRKRNEGILVIDIPKPPRNGFSSSINTPLNSSKIPSNSPLPTSQLLEEIQSPVIAKMKSFKRMVNRVSFKGVGSSYSPIGYDIEQGRVGESKHR